MSVGANGGELSSEGGSDSDVGEVYLCDYERERLNNIKENQEMLKMLGLPMSVEGGRQSRGTKSKRTRTARGRARRQRKRVTYCSPGSNSSDSDKEWEPWMSPHHSHKKKSKNKGDGELAPLDMATRLELLRAVDEEVDECLLQVMEAKKNSKSAKRGRRNIFQQRPKSNSTDLDTGTILPEPFDNLSDDEDFYGFPSDAAILGTPSDCTVSYTLQDCAGILFDSSTEEQETFEGFTRYDVCHTALPAMKRYPKRKGGSIEYKEDVLSDEDEYLLCDDCNSLYHGDCPVHGPLKQLDLTAGYDHASLTYTQLPVPAQVTIKPSSIPNAGLGTFATQFIARGVRVGPYEGRRVDRQDMGDLQDTQYIWEIRREGESYFIDGHDPTYSNWMRFVNCARHEDEQNLLAFQFHGDIYYRTFKNIYPGTELLVWYGDQYAKELGIELHSNDTCAEYECLGCGASFIEKSSFDVHIKHSVRCAEANPRTFTCGICKQTFTQLEQLQGHIRKHGDVGSLTHTGDKPYKCEHCGKCFSQRGSLQKHLRIHTGDKPYKCEHCGKCFSQRGHLQGHLLTHTGDKPYKCEHCGKCFSRRDNLQGHLRTHTGDKPYKCEHCGECFSHRGSLQGHLRTHTGDKPYKCEHCGKCFSQRGDLQRHLRTHTGDKPYKCEHCGKCFSERGHLQRHLRTHTGDKPYKCEHCGECFSRRDYLQGHLRTHTGDKPYKCEHCRKCFSHRATLQGHLRTHTGDKPYKCEHCGKCFSHRGDLQRHLLTHTGDKPYKCEHCGKCFSQRGSLQGHLRTHTGDKPYKCEHCGTCFATNSSLHSHIRNKHM